MQVLTSPARYSPRYHWPPPRAWASRLSSSTRWAASGGVAAGSPGGPPAPAGGGDLQVIDVPGRGEEPPHQRPRRRYLASPQQDLRLVRRGADALVAAAGTLLRDHLVGQGKHLVPAAEVSERPEARTTDPHRRPGEAAPFGEVDPRP